MRPTPTPTDAVTDAGVPSPILFPHAFHKRTRAFCKIPPTTRATDRGMPGRLPRYAVVTCIYLSNQSTHPQAPRVLDASFRPKSIGFPTSCHFPLAIAHSVLPISEERD